MEGKSANTIYFILTANQIKHLITLLLFHSKIGGMCMSEPNAGTDVLGMKSNAVYDSTRDGFVLNGAKVSVLYAICILHKVQNYCLLKDDHV
jgi:alkylation response protein AidB-like acyl-CoA dehydrogenase